MVIGDLMTRTLEPPTSGTCTGRLAQALGMISNAMHSLGELKAKITVEQGSIQMVANLVDDDGEEDEEESLEDEEDVFKGVRATLVP